MTLVEPTRTPTPTPTQSGERPEPVVITLDAVSKVYRSRRTAVPALDAISLTIPRHGFTCIVGASGCGKSTLLNLLAGLDTPTAGTLDVVGRTGLMFQESALFPWLTVTANVELALKLRKVPRAVRRDRVDELLELVHLAEFADKRPHELSGGMRQRVALARALAQDADILLMDEPFGSLDAMTRDVMHDELESIWQRTGATIVFVTHNVREAARLGDRIVLLSSRPGRVAQIFDVDLARPRRIEDRAVSELAAEVTASLRKEVVRHGRR
jgi:NitT/TauT family transport system ATP-binding protein